MSVGKACSGPRGLAQLATNTDRGSGFTTSIPSHPIHRTQTDVGLGTHAQAQEHTQVQEQEYTHTFTNDSLSMESITFFLEVTVRNADAARIVKLTR